MAVADETYRALYFIIVVFAAFALPSRERLAAQIALIIAALLVPVSGQDDRASRSASRCCSARCW